MELLGFAADGGAQLMDPEIVLVVQDRFKVKLPVWFPDLHAASLKLQVLVTLGLRVNIRKVIR